jgi:hypothetical protein
LVDHLTDAQRAAIAGDPTIRPLPRWLNPDLVPQESREATVQAEKDARAIYDAVVLDERALGRRRPQRQ